MDAVDESNWVGSPIKTALGCLTDSVGAIAAVASTQSDLLIKKALRLPVRFVSTVPGTSPYWIVRAAARPTCVLSIAGEVDTLCGDDCVLFRSDDVCVCDTSRVRYYRMGPLSVPTLRTVSSHAVDDRNRAVAPTAFARVERRRTVLGRRFGLVTERGRWSVQRRSVQPKRVPVMVRRQCARKSVNPFALRSAPIDRITFALVDGNHRG
jgi:hypothetical protein